MEEQSKGNRHPFLKGMKERLAFSPADTRPRVMLIFLAIVLQLIASLFSGVGFSVNGPEYWLTGMFLWLLWFCLMFAIVIPRTDTLRQRYQGWLKRGAMIIFITLLIVGIGEVVILKVYTAGYLGSSDKNNLTKSLEQMEHGFQYNDGTALIHQAAENLLKGKNPYAEANIVKAFNEFNGSYDRVTPLRKGRFADVFPYPTPEQLKQIWDTAIQDPSQPPPEIESHVCYPAGSFLLVAPFIAAGIKDIRLVYVIFVVAGLVYGAWRIPGRRRLIFIGAVLISLEIWNSLAIGETGSNIFPFLLIAWMTIGKSNRVSAIFMGLAVATKQTAWFFLPFYLILLWRTVAPKTIAATLGIIIAIFIAVNGYFVAIDPGLWLRSITAPMSEPIFPLGVGAISLVTGGFLDIRTALPFTVMELIVFVGAIVWYMRYCRRYPDAGLILAVLPLFFAWRSLWTYFFYITIFILARLLIEDENEPKALGVGQTNI